MQGFSTAGLLTLLAVFTFFDENRMLILVLSVVVIKFQRRPGIVRITNSPFCIYADYSCHTSVPLCSSVLSFGCCAAVFLAPQLFTARLLLHTTTRMTCP